MVHLLFIFNIIITHAQIVPSLASGTFSNWHNLGFDNFLSDIIWYLGSSYLFPVPDPELAISPCSTGSFKWAMVHGDLICVLWVLTAISTVSFNWETQEVPVCLCICPHLSHQSWNTWWIWTYASFQFLDYMAFTQFF